LLCSRDLGKTWAEKNTGITSQNWVSFSISPDFSDDQTMFAGGSGGGIYVSVDGGSNWKPSGENLVDLDISAVSLSPDFGSDGLLLTATQAGLYRSVDRGQSWSECVEGFDLDDVRAVAFSSTYSSDSIIFAGGALGLTYQSSDGGVSWKRLVHDFDGETVVAVSTGPNFAKDRTVFVGTIGITAAAVHVSYDGGESFERFVEHETTTPWVSLGVPGSYSEEDRTWLFSTSSQVFRPTERFQDVWTGTYPADSETAVLTIAITPTFTEDTTVYAGTSKGVFRSGNGGSGWSELNAGLKNLAVLKVVASPAYAADHAVFAMALGGEIWRFVDDPETRRGEVLEPTDIV
jgi:photosystem II stability/assembly factor-like uncharacterized protein